ncbi:TetR/AcrR family transcriptional regulator [Streptosporangium sp. NPDC049376]|uniref:TetR/AcrR family transcriptional regulator n=1 Tax=Streptosporangium sp. NPDC049376 TaxID=3366192 RepID=UPI00379CD0D3
MTRSTRERILEEALRLFAERGYAATSVAEIESAAGLSPGAGGLYRHFRSKYEVLAASVNERVVRVEARVAAMGAADPAAPVTERLTGLCEAGLAVVREEDELVRVFFRDLGRFPELVEVVRARLLQPMFDAIGSWLCAQPEYAGAGLDRSSVGAVLGGSLVHCLLFEETVGEPPGRTERERFVTSWVSLALGLLPVAQGCPREPELSQT